MLSLASFALSVRVITFVTAALASEHHAECSVQLNDLSLLQVQSSHVAMVSRESSLVEKEAEAQMAFIDIRDQLRAHPKVAKQALHEALIEMQQSSGAWPFSTGTSQRSPEPVALADASTRGIQGVQKSSRQVPVPQMAAQQQQQSQQVAGIAAPAEPVGSNEKATAKSAKSAKPTDGMQIAPFGKEDTARELTQHAVDTQDTLVDAVENAEVAEVKRAVFRSLTRLRAASIKEFDTIARLETQAFDEYNDAHHYRSENPLEYLHSSEPKVKEDKYTSFH